MLFGALWGTPERNIWNAATAKVDCHTNLPALQGFAYMYDEATCTTTIDKPTNTKGGHTPLAHHPALRGST
jgi:hypothetical protein